MIGRRGIIGLLIGSPLIAKEAAAEIEKVAMSAGEVSIGNRPVDCAPSNDHWRFIPGGSRAMGALRDELQLREEREYRNLPPHIAERKSWSTAFKNSVAEAERRKMKSLWREFHDLDSSDPIGAGLKFAKLAKKLGMKV